MPKRSQARKSARRPESHAPNPRNLPDPLPGATPPQKPLPGAADPALDVDPVDPTPFVDPESEVPEELLGPVVG
jgi:hypothetical protein